MNDHISVTALGTGGAFSIAMFHNNYILEFESTTLLVDAGTTLRYSLERSIHDYDDITDILITHFHSDHIGGLEEFAQRCKFIYNHVPRLWVREDQNLDLIGLMHGLDNGGLTIHDYFDIRQFDVDSGFHLDSTHIQTIRTDNMHSYGMKSLGFKINSGTGKSLLFTGDVKHLEYSRFNELADKDTYIFQDYSSYANPVHASTEDIVNYYSLEQLDNMFLMHYDDAMFYQVDPFSVKYMGGDIVINLVCQSETYLI